MWASLNMHHLCKYTCICIHYTQAPNVCLFIKSVLRDWKTWNLTFILLSLSSSDQYTVLSFMVIEINVNVRLEKPFIAPHLYTVLSEGGDLMTFKDERSVRLCCYELYWVLLLTNSCEDFGFKLLYVLFTLSPKILGYNLKRSIMHSRKMDRRYLKSYNLLTRLSKWTEHKRKIPEICI